MRNKDTKIDEMMLYNLFIFADDSCKMIKNYVDYHWLEQENKPFRKPKRLALSESETITILVYYHYSGYKNFEYYYKQFVLTDLKTYFPQAPSYTHFLELESRVSILMPLIMQLTCENASRSQIYFADSKRIPVCDNLRISSHKVFKQTGARGKSSTGWFYGFKAHLVINNWGQIISFRLTAANKSDNNSDILVKLFSNLKGMCIADKGYITKLWQQFYENGLKIVHKIKKNMKNKLLLLEEKYYLNKRGVIESVNDILDSVFNLTHSRYRKPENAFCSICACLIAYQFYPDKPSVYYHDNKQK
ncbi:IS982 family transposase [Microcoleus sp. herbarium19]|uniref:IS982 family transposase n=1 Tax=unclassified Microcoleus TaxID=2642155 RepID=UPI002FD082D3